jgi:hypothetical protein
MKSITFSRSEDPGFLEIREHATEVLAAQLSAGRLVLVLGAGVSFASGLPLWGALTKQLAECAGVVVPIGIKDEDAADHILRSLHGDELALARATQKALYDDWTGTLPTLAATPMIYALGAMCMGGRRGRVSSLITFNYDDLLEKYLEYLGVAVAQVVVLPEWDGGADVKMLHPHGLLRSDGREPEERIVLAQVHFDLGGSRHDLWRRELVRIMSSNTCLFVGLSGDDRNLRAAMVEAASGHVSRNGRHARWGVRLARAATDEFV